MASYYGKALAKVIKVGDGYMDKEIARLNKLIEGAGTTPDKIDNFYLRKNILTTFKLGPGIAPQKEQVEEEEIEHSEL